MVSIPRFLIVVLLCALLAACAGIAQPQETSSPTAIPEPTVVESALVLGPAPQGCPPGPTPQEIAPYFGGTIGGSPVWAIGFAGPEARVYVGDLVRWGAYGAYYKILWVVEPGYSDATTLRGGDLTEENPLWFQVGEEQPSTSPVLDPQNPGIPIQHGEWIEFPSYLFIPQAGCYYLEAIFPEGSWRITFAAGR